MSGTMGVGFVGGKGKVVTRLLEARAKLQKFAVIAVAGDADPGRPQREAVKKLKIGYFRR